MSNPDTTQTTDLRAQDIPWLAGMLETIWEWGRKGERHPFDVLASDVLNCLDGYTAPPSAADPVQGDAIAPNRVRL